MIARVEVTLENDTPQDRMGGFRCSKVVIFDGNENSTDRPDLIDHKEYASRHLLVQELSRRVGTAYGIIEVTGKDTLKDDGDTQEEELYDNGTPYPLEMPREVEIRESKFSIFEWLRKLKEGKMLLTPDFQRHLVWKDDQRSRFIESILLNIPLPPLYVREDKEGRYIIVDGQQRTSTLRDFEEGKFKLSGLQILKKLDGKSFNDLDSGLKATIEDKQLSFYIIKLTVPLPMIYEIFNRINTGGTQLTRQEIRNCIFLGRATRLLKKLSEQEYFKLAIDYGISLKRMKDREAILRYLAFKIFNYDRDYKDDMDDFLGTTMKAINQMNEDETSALEKDFERVMKLTYEFFGPRNFRLPTEKSKGRINIALMESISYFFSIHPDQFLNHHKEKIKKNFDRLFGDRDFIESVIRSTGGKGKVIKRFKTVQEILGDV
ncbi:MAG: DUF262 domain-containing protein [Candidatus Aminicenantes bacterium]|nr:DUF262 domain-containing protein [Candidatus Aminicenantes bacterium]